jgi:3-deoxy-D-arabino-heptulosonate 7-phosphate (DAHP) synthase class II
MWNVYSWKNYILKHNPIYANSKLTLEALSNYHPLVNFSEIDLLSSVFENLQLNNQFILQIGECAESFL